MRAREFHWRRDKLSLAQFRGVPRVRRWRRISCEIQIRCAAAANFAYVRARLASLRRKVAAERRINYAQLSLAQLLTQVVERKKRAFCRRCRLQQPPPHTGEFTFVGRPAPRKRRRRPAANVAGGANRRLARDAQQLLKSPAQLNRILFPRTAVVVVQFQLEIGQLHATRRPSIGRHL